MKGVFDIALINCPECNREISDKAENCPHCGYPIQRNIENKSNELYNVNLLKDKSTIIKSIQLLREYYGYGLKEAKDIVDIAPIIIAKDFNREEVIRFSQPFLNNLIKIKILNSDGETVDIGIKPQPPNNKYYSNEPLTSNSIHQNIPKCPTCNSSNINKIPLEQKVIGGAMFGLFSSKVRKTFECKNCGYKW